MKTLTIKINKMAVEEKARAPSPFKKFSPKERKHGCFKELALKVRNSKCMFKKKKPWYCDDCGTQAYEVKINGYWRLVCPNKHCKNEEVVLT